VVTLPWTLSRQWTTWTESGATDTCVAEILRVTVCLAC
jgi:hypothetical protein